MPTWVLQAAAIAVGLLVLGFFAFASAYYVRNRRMALAARCHVQPAGMGAARAHGDVDGRTEDRESGVTSGDRRSSDEE